MLKPFMRLFGIDDELPIEPQRGDGQKRGAEAVPGQQMEGTGVLTDGLRRRSESETELEKAANARQ